MSQKVPQRKRYLLALALAEGVPIQAAADRVGVCRKTVHRYLARPDFRKLVARFRGEMVTTALGRMTENMTRAADAVAELLAAPEPHIRLRAARALLGYGMKLRDSIDVSDRISELETELARKQGIEA